MKDEVISLVGDAIKDMDLLVDDSFVEKQEGENVLNIVLDSEEVIDLNKITDASRIINESLDKSDLIEKYDIAQVDIYSKEKGEV